MTATTNQWAESVFNKNIQARKDFHEKKCKELGNTYTERIKELLGIYFNGYSEIEEENKVSFNLLNKEWKTYATNANRVQKYVKLKVDIFETEVKRITENKQDAKS